MTVGLHRYATMINLVFFNVGWLACVMGAGRGYLLLGPLLVPPLVALQLALISENPRRETHFILATCFFGVVADTAMIYGGVYVPLRGMLPWPLLPLWMVALWLNFGYAMNLSLSWFRDRPIPAALFGAIGGPLAYYAGAHLGAVILNPDPFRSFGVLVPLWGFSVPFLFFLSRKIVKDKQPETGSRTVQKSFRNR